MEIEFYQYFSVPPVSACPIVGTCTWDRPPVVRADHPCGATIRARNGNGIRRA
jgi:hypothetical protein